MASSIEFVLGADVEPNDIKADSNNLEEVRTIRGELSGRGGDMYDSFLILKVKEIPRNVTATAKIVEGANTGTSDFGFAGATDSSLHRDDEYWRANGFNIESRPAAGGVGRTLRINANRPYRRIDPVNEIHLQISSNVPCRYEIEIKSKNSDKIRPTIEFGAKLRDLNARNKRKLKRSQRSTPFIVWDIGGLKYYRAYVVGGRRISERLGNGKYPAQTIQHFRYRFKRLRPTERVYIRAEDMSGNIKLKVVTFRRRGTQNTRLMPPLDSVR